jgi:chromosome partitioning protein
VTSRYGLEVLDPPIAKSIRFAEAPAAGRSVLCTASRTRGAEGYRQLARNLLGLAAPEPDQVVDLSTPVADQAPTPTEVIA